MEKFFQENGKDLVQLFLEMKKDIASLPGPVEDYLSDKHGDDDENFWDRMSDMALKIKEAGFKV